MLKYLNIKFIFKTILIDIEVLLFLKIKELIYFTYIKKYIQYIKKL
jgi:hypothetical protein